MLRKNPGLDRAPAGRGGRLARVEAAKTVSPRACCVAREEKEPNVGSLDDPFRYLARGVVRPSPVFVSLVVFDESQGNRSIGRARSRMEAA